MTTLLPGALALAAAVPLAVAARAVNASFGAQPERAVMVVGVLCALMIAAPVVVYLAVKRTAVAADRLGLVALLAVVVALAGIDLYWLAAHVSFPADFLIWSESDYVNDILKLRVGYPLYTASANNDSFVYLFGSQYLTYGIAKLLGHPTSIVTYRAIQVAYTLLAAAVGVLCCRRLVLLSAAGERDRVVSPGALTLWSAIWLPALFLFATNAVTNPFVMELHNDALSQLVSVVAFWLLLEYVATRSPRVLAAMALVPVAGFLVKQSLVIWAALYVGYLLVFDRPRSLRRTIAFAAAAFGLVAVAFAVCYARWGSLFVYWGFTVLGKHGVSPLRSFQHVLDVWAYFAAGIIGGLVLLRGERMRVLFGPWLIWLGILATEAYTSGVAWMLNHMGPGCLLAGVWLLAGAARLWSEVLERRVMPNGERWLRAGMGVAVAGLALGGLAVVRIPTAPITPDAYRYVHDIEREFAGVPADSVLLDAGTWVYQKDGVVMKDRAPTIGERGWSMTGDFSGTIARIRAHRYAKILVRNLNEPDFWYEDARWRKPSGIKQALLDSYRVARTIPAVDTRGDRSRYLFGEISVLVPKE